MPTSTLRTADGLNLNFYAWPVQHARDAVLILHGYADHGGRYEELAQRFNSTGSSAFALDFRGHGRSDSVAGVRGHIHDFSDYRLDIDSALQHILSTTSRASPAVFAHSMGCAAALDWLLSRPGTPVDRFMFSSPFLGLARPLGAARRALVQALSALLPTLRLPLPFTGKDLCRDPARLQQHASDPLVNHAATARWAGRALPAIDRLSRQAPSTPARFLVLYAGADRVADAGKTTTFFAGLRAPCELHPVKDAYHEILNEPPPERQRVLSMFAQWLAGKP